MRRPIALIGPLLLGGILLGVPVEVFAQNGAPPYAGLGEMIVNFAGVLAAINTFMHILLLTLLKMLGYFLQADFFNDVEMMSALNNVWQLSRNIMNVLFAIALIAVSFYTIVTAKTQLIKDKWSHFVLAVILVNFSWFFPRVIIDVANVLTATVYNIPSTLPAFDCFEIGKEGAPPKPCEVVVDAGFFLSEEQQKDFCTDNGVTYGTSSCSCFAGLGCYAKDTWVNSVTRTDGKGMRPAHAMINGMAVSFAKITNYAQIPEVLSDPDNIDVAQVTLQVIMGVLMAFLVQIAMVLPLLGIGIGLFLRIIIMWVCVAFMPFTFIGFMVNGKLGTNVFGFETDVWKEFLNAAFLPTIVAVPMTVGFIMLTTVAKVPAPDGLDSFFVPLIPGIQGWWPLLWIFAAIGIMWVGTFAALRKSQIVGKVTDKLQGIGQQAFGTAARLPLLAPLPFPNPNGKGQMAVGDLFAAPREFGDVVRAATRRGMTYKEAFGQGEQNEKPKDAAELVRLFQTNNRLQEKTREKLSELRDATLQNKPEAERRQILQNLKVDLNMNDLTDQKFAGEMLKLKNEQGVDQSLKNLIDSDLRPELERIRNLP